MPDNYSIDLNKKFNDDKDEYALKYKNFMEKYEKYFNKEYNYCENNSPFDLIDCPCGLKFKYRSYKIHTKCKRHMILLNVLGITNDSKNDLDILKKNDII